MTEWNDLPVFVSINNVIYELDEELEAIMEEDKLEREDYENEKERQLIEKSVYFENRWRLKEKRENKFCLKSPDGSTLSKKIRDQIIRYYGELELKNKGCQRGVYVIAMVYYVCNLHELKPSKTEVELWQKQMGIRSVSKIRNKLLNVLVNEIASRIKAFPSS